MAKDAPDIQPDLGLTRLFEQIRRSIDATFRDVLGSVPDAMVIVDGRGRIVFVNELTERLFGYTRDQLVGQAVDMLVPDRLRPRHLEHRSAYFRDPRARPMGVGLELYGRRKDGTEFPVEISLSPLKTEDGFLALSAIRDVSERKAAEERAQLLIREQTTRAALEDAVRLRDGFISVAAHELKTPITSLRGFAELLLREVSSNGVPEPQRLERGLRRIDEQSRRLARLVEQLLDVGRIQSGKLGLEPAAVDVVALVREVAKGAGREVVVHGPDALSATVDPLGLERVLTNLVDNAVKYVPAGSPIAVDIRGTGDGIEIVVADAGPGIAPADRERIFEPFYRGDSDSGASGMGLGLYVSRQIVEQHGGTLSAVFPKAGGTRMVVALPSLATKPAEQPTDPTRP